MSRQEIQDALSIKTAEYVRKHYIAPALKAGFIQMSVPDKASSPHQKYVLTEEGRNLIDNSKHR